MPILIRILSLLAAGDRDVAALKSISALFGNNAGKLANLIAGLSKAEEGELKERFGEALLKRVKSSVGIKDKYLPIPTTAVNSSWIESISWNPLLHVLKLKVKTGKHKTYDLPFFPYRVARAMLVNKSPGKTIWNGYWRVVGKGSVKNKAKNLARVAPTKALVKITNRAIPKTRKPKQTKRKVLTTTRVIKNVKVKTRNIPKTGAKGIKITVRSPFG